MSEHILPCPHCGNVVIKISVYSGGGMSDEVFLECDDCGSRGPVELDYPTALRRWNERKPDAWRDKYKQVEVLIEQMREGYSRAIENASYWRDQAFESQARNKTLTLEADRFAACCHQVRLMPEDGTEDDFVAAVDAYRDEHGL